MFLEFQCGVSFFILQIHCALIIGASRSGFYGRPVKLVGKVSQHYYLSLACEAYLRDAYANHAQKNAGEIRTRSVPHFMLVLHGTDAGWRIRVELESRLRDSFPVKSRPAITFQITRPGVPLSQGE